MATDLNAVHDLLEKLSNDDETRNAFEADPISVLESHGIERPVAKLPSKEELQSNMKKYQEEAEKNRAFMFFFMMH